MIATEVYKIVKATVGPWLKENGFKVIKQSWPVYQRSVGDQFITIKFRINRGWDKYKGATFNVWFKQSREKDVDDGSRYDLVRQLSLPEREFIRARQNRILEALGPPPVDYVSQIVDSFQRTFRDPQLMIATFLKDWQPHTEPYGSDSQISLRYTCAEDVRAWSLLMLNHIRVRYERALAETQEK